MVLPRFNLLEQLNINIISAQKASKVDSKRRSFDNGDIPEVFRWMHDVASLLAYKEGVTWIQVKYKQDLIDRMEQREARKSAGEDAGALPPLLEKQLLDFVNERQEGYMQRMIQLLELYAKSKWGGKDKL